jgi:hypothetical protein
MSSLKMVSCRSYFNVNFNIVFRTIRAHGGVVIKALHYKPAGHELNSRWCHWNFSVT